MLKQKKRTVISHNAIYFFANDAPFTIPKDFSVIKIFEKLRDILKEKTVGYANTKGSLAVFLDEVHISDDKLFATLLFSLRDKEGVDQATGSLLKKDIRLHTKDDTEGTAYSCHLVVTLEPDIHGKFYAFREYITGFHERYLISLLNKEFRKLCGMTYEGEKGSDRKTHPKITLSTLPSQELLEDIENGQLSFIEFTSAKKAKQLDRITESISEKRVVTVELSKQKDQANYQTALTTLFDKIKPQEAKFFFKDAEKTYSVTVLNGDDLASVVFAKKKQVQVSRPIPQASEKIHGELKTRMIKLAQLESGLGVVHENSNEGKHLTEADTISKNRVA